MHQSDDMLEDPCKLRVSPVQQCHTQAHTNSLAHGYQGKPTVRDKMGEHDPLMPGGMIFSVIKCE